MRFLAILLLLSSLASAQTSRLHANDTPAAQAEAPQKTPPESRGTSSRSEDLQALRQDIARMKVLVQQMQSNLAFVDTTQSPLKHQFQLEIDMWQTLITEMERRLAEPAKPSAP
jgi:hypothetical protein